MPGQEPTELQLQVNTSGAWKTLLRFAAGDVRTASLARDGAYMLAEAEPALAFRVATCESLPRVLYRLDRRSGGWREEKLA